MWRTTRRKRRRAHQNLISIHVPRVEDDSEKVTVTEEPLDFNPRPPCGGRRAMRLSLSLRTAYFNPRPPCGGRRGHDKRGAGGQKFQSTSPVWRTTRPRSSSCRSMPISIHVPRVEDDTGRWGRRCSTLYFNPRPPCGGRLLRSVLKARTSSFQSTSPVWRTTCAQLTACSIRTHFNPRPPCGGRQHSVNRGLAPNHISIHVPRVEDDLADYVVLLSRFISIHVPRVEDDTILLPPHGTRCNFNPRPPCGGRQARKRVREMKKEFQSTSPVWRTTRARIPVVPLSANFNPRPPCGGRLRA